MLDWARVDTYQAFQRLVNHLFALECNSPGFIPSSPYIGADGGWDGSFDGRYPPEDISGKWMIQSKWTKHSGKKAYEHLRREVRDSARKAKANKVQHLRVATNADLKVEYVQTLENMKEGQGCSLHIWPRETLTTRIEHQPYLRHLFFGRPQYPKFVPWPVYFQEMETHLLLDQASGIGTFDAAVNSVLHFLRSDQHSVLLIRGHGGSGKSHLLRAVAEKAHHVTPDTQTWLVRHGVRDLPAAFQDELVAGRKYLLILDDADRLLGDAREILSFARGQPAFCKAILAYRSAGHFAVDGLISETRCGAIADKVRMVPWKPDELVALLRHAAGKPTVKNERQIVAAHRDLYMIATLGQQIKTRGAVDWPAFIDKLHRETLRDAEQATTGVLSRRSLRALLFQTACLVPCPRDGQSSTKAATNACEISVADHDEALSRLLDAGVLRSVGGKLRFCPDMKGDLLLSKELENLSEDALCDLIGQHLGIAPKEFIVNIRAAARYTSSAFLRDAVANVVRSWVGESTNTTPTIRADRLERVEHLCGLAPEECLDLLAEYARIERASASRPKRRRMRRRHLTTDNYGPAMLELARHARSRANVLKVLESLSSENLRGTFGNYHTGAVLRRCVSPLYNRVPRILETLGALAAWVDNPNREKLALLREALSEVLAGAHGHEESDLTSVRFGQRCLLDTAQARVLRDLAMGIWRQLIAKPSREAQLTSLEVATEHGELPMGTPVPSPLPLQEKITAEKCEMAERLGELLLSDASDVVKSCAETVLLHWWAQHAPQARVAEGYLARFQRSVEYLVLRHFIDACNVVEDFSQILQDAPDEDRWDWYFEHVDNRGFRRTLTDFQTLAAALNEKYNTPEDAVRYLAGLNRQINRAERPTHPPLVMCWAERGLGLFRAIGRSRRLWKQLPKRFRLDVDMALASVDRTHVETLANQILSGSRAPDASQVEGFLQILQMRSDLSQKRLLGWLRPLVGKAGPAASNVILFRVGSVFDRFKSASAQVRIMLAVLKKHRKVGRFLHSLAFTAHHMQREKKAVGKHMSQQLRELLRDRLKAVDVFNHDADRLACFCCRDVQDVCGLLGHRLIEQERRFRGRKGQSRYDPFPTHGMRCLKSHIADYTDFDVFMDWVVEIHGKKMLLAGLHLPHALESVIRDGEKSNTKELCWLRRYVKTKTVKGAIGDALNAAFYVPFTPASLKTLADLFDAASQHNLADEAQDLLRRRVYPEGVYGSGIGQDPPALVERKQFFESLTDRVAPGSIRSTLKSCAATVEKAIELERREDEEVLNPRG